MRKEANFQTKFNEYLRTVYKTTGAFELKQTKTILPFTAVKEHQINALYAAKHGTFVYKIPDDTRNYKPFDCFSFSFQPAYVVVKFLKNFYGIDIDVFIKESKISVRRSLTENRAKEIAAFGG